MRGDIWNEVFTYDLLNAVAVVFLCKTEHVMIKVSLLLHILDTYGGQFFEIWAVCTVIGIDAITTL